MNRFHLLMPQMFASHLHAKHCSVVSVVDGIKPNTTSILKGRRRRIGRRRSFSTNTATTVSSTDAREP